MKTPVEYAREAASGDAVFGNQVEHDLLSGAVAPAPEEGDNVRMSDCAN